MSFDCCSTGNAEEHATLSRALSQLAEVEEKIEQLHIQQVTTVINLYFSTVNCEFLLLLSMVSSQGQFSNILQLLSFIFILF